MLWIEKKGKQKNIFLSWHGHFFFLCHVISYRTVRYTQANLFIASLQKHVTTMPNNITSKAMYDLTLQKKILLYGTFQTIYLIHFIILAHRPECVLYTHTYTRTDRILLGYIFTCTFYMKKRTFSLYFTSQKP